MASSPRAERPSLKQSSSPALKTPKRARKGASIRLRLTAAEKKSWLRAAEKNHRTLSDWIRFLANTSIHSNDES